MHKFILLALVLIFSGCALNPGVNGYKPPDDNSAIEQRTLMVGIWFGDSPTKDGGRKMHIVERALDGTMKIRFRLIDSDGTVEEQTELAQWGISGNFYFSISRGILDGEKFYPFDPTQPYFNDVYEVLELTNKQFRYRHVSTGSEFTIARVADDFDFP